MSRSVVRTSTVRCERCLFPPRWCVCAGFHTVECPVRIDVLMHDMEALRPSSTGHLIKRVMPASGQHIFRRERPLEPSEIIDPGKELWILHPLGEPVPADTAPENLQILLLDGNWRQAAAMLRTVEKMGRRVRLPMSGESRYWLRAQQGEGQFSTMEALMHLIDALGYREICDQLRLQFELHVFAGLCSRGHKIDAAEYLKNSPIREAMPEVLSALLARHPHSSGGMLARPA